VAYRHWSLEGRRIENRYLVTGFPAVDVGVVWSPTAQTSFATHTFLSFIFKWS